MRDRHNYLGKLSVVQVEFRYSELRQLFIRTMPHSLDNSEIASTYSSATLCVLRYY